MLKVVVTCHMYVCSSVCSRIHNEMGRREMVIVLHREDIEAGPSTSEIDQFRSFRPRRAASDLIYHEKIVVILGEERAHILQLPRCLGCDFSVEFEGELMAASSGSLEHREVHRARIPRCRS